MSSTQVPSSPGRGDAPGPAVSPTRQPQTPPATAATPPGNGLPRRLLLIGLWALATLGLALFYFKRFFPGDLTDVDAIDSAQVARNLALHHTFSTSVIRPLAVTGTSPILSLSPDGTTPDISNAPLFPSLLAFVFAATHHDGPKFVVGLSLLFYLLSIWAVYRLGRAFFPAPGQHWIAALSAGVFILGGEALQYAITGLPVTLSIFLVTLLILALHRAHETPRRTAGPIHELLVGVLLGLCYLTQYSLLLLVIPTLVYVYASRAPQRAWRGVGLCAAGFLLVSLPWLIRTAVVCHGNPFFTLKLYGVMAQTDEYPGATTIFRSVLPADSPLTFFFTHLKELVPKVSTGLQMYQTQLLSAFNLFVFAAASISLFWRAADGRINALRGYVAFCALSIVVASVVFVPEVQMIAPFGPVLIVVALGFIGSILQQPGWQPQSQRFAVWAFAILVAGSLFGKLLAQKPELNPIRDTLRWMSVWTNEAGTLHDPLVPPLEGPNESNRTEIIMNSVRQGAVISDDPWELAWAMGLPSVWIPTNNESYNSLKVAAQGRLPMSALLLSPMIARYNYGGGEAKSWALLTREPLAWEKGQQQLATGNPLATLMQRRDVFRENILRSGLAPSVKAVQLQKLNSLYQTELVKLREHIANDIIQESHNEYIKNHDPTRPPWTQQQAMQMMPRVLQQHAQDVQDLVNKQYPFLPEISDVLADFTTYVPALDPKAPPGSPDAQPHLLQYTDEHGYSSVLFFSRSLTPALMPRPSAPQKAAH